MPICNARKRRCSKCGHKFSKEEHHLWECPECGADRHCRRNVKVEGQRCRLHGGESPGGIVSPNFKHGRYSKYLPTQLAERYQESLKDQEILALRDEIALLDARLGDLIDSLDVGSSKMLWESLEKHYANLRKALASQDADSASKSMRDIGQDISDGRKQTDNWNEIYVLLDGRRKLVESERKRLVQMHQVITTEEAMGMLATIQQSIAENISDKRVLAAIAADLSKFIVK